MLKKYPVTRVFLLLVIVFALLTAFLPTLAGNHLKSDEGDLDVDIPVVFEGNWYEPEDFNHLMQAEFQEIDFIFIPSTVISEEPGQEFVYAFRSVDEAIKFLENKNVDLVKEGYTPHPEPVEVPSNKESSIQPARDDVCDASEMVPDRYYDPIGCDLPSIDVSFDLADLSVIGSNWDDRISSASVGGSSVILYDGKDYKWTGYLLPATYVEPNLGWFSDRASSLDFYPFR
jgi:hypothetical protein